MVHLWTAVWQDKVENHDVDCWWDPNIWPNFFSSSALFHLLVTSGIVETTAAGKRRWNITERLGAVVNAIFRYTYYNIQLRANGLLFCMLRGNRNLPQKWWWIGWENTRQLYLKDWTADSGVQPKATNDHIPAWISVCFWYLASWHDDVAVHTMNVALQCQHKCSVCFVSGLQLHFQEIYLFNLWATCQWYSVHSFHLCMYS